MNPFNHRALEYRQIRQSHWDGVARRLDNWQGWGRSYQHLLLDQYRRRIPPGLRVLEVGCGLGDLLAGLQPSLGVGVDFSKEMLHTAAARHPKLHFALMDATYPALECTFDVVILSDLVNDLWDVQTVLACLHRLCHPRTRLVLNSYSRLWELPLKTAQSLGLSKPNLDQNWLTVEDISNLLALTGFEVIKTERELLFPFRLPGMDGLSNRYLVRFWPFNHGALTNFMIARPQPGSLPEDDSLPPRVSVVVPARNEAGNIAPLLERVPEMGGGTELIFVEGNSTDDTFNAIFKGIQQNPDRRCKLIKQMGKGKGDAVRLGLCAASGQVVMVLDADMTVPPEDLPRFYQALVDGRGELVNGVRLVYPLEDQAMRFLNLTGNKFFSLAFSWLLGQPVKDTLCGTKVLWKRDYDLIAANREYFGDFDPFGDFDLLFGAARLNLKIVDLPVRYAARTYGTTNIQRWRHGWLLLEMVVFAARRLKFV